MTKKIKVVLPSLESLGLAEDTECQKFLKKAEVHKLFTELEKKLADLDKAYKAMNTNYYTKLITQAQSYGLDYLKKHLEPMKDRKQEVVRISTDIENKITELLQHIDQHK